MKKIYLLVFCMLLLTSCQKDNKNKIPNIKDENAITNLSHTKDDLLIEGYFIDQALVYENRIVIYYLSTTVNEGIICTYDVDSYELLHEIEAPEYSRDVKLMELDNGFYINGKESLYIYDYNLHLLNTIKLDFIKADGKLQYALSNNQNKLVYISKNDEGETLIKTRDLSTQKEEILYKTSIEAEAYKLLQIETLFFKNEYVGFVGQYLKSLTPGTSSIQVYGNINIINKKINYHERNDIQAKYLHGYMMLYDQITVAQNDRGSKKVDIYNIEKDTTITIDLIDSYTGFNVEILSPNLVLSFSGLGLDKAEVLVYQNGKFKKIDTELPTTTDYAEACFIPNTSKILIWYEDEETQKIIEIVLEDL